MVMATATTPELDCFVASDMGEDLLAAMYLMLKDSGLLSVVFYGRTPTLREFLGWHERKDAMYLGAFVRSHVGRPELAGMGWVWDISGPEGCKRGNVDIVFLRKFWGKIPEFLCRQMLDYVFGNGIGVLYAVTPARNRAARNLGERLGFVWRGPFPRWGVRNGKQEDAVLGYLMRETWLEVRT